MPSIIKAGLSLLLLCSTSLHAQTDTLDRFIKQTMEKRRIPGLQLAIVKDGMIIRSGNYGLANVQDSIPVSDKTVFPVNSITKAFTGVAVMQLVEAGRLKLEDPVSKHLADLPEAWKPVTVQQLLSHSSGLPDIVDEETSMMIGDGFDDAWAKVIAMPMLFAPGERFQYNQANYLLIGRIIDKLSGMSFQEYIIKEQLERAGMPYTIRAGFGASKDVVPHAAAGYHFQRGKLQNMFFSFPPVLQTAAGMSSTAREMAAWIIALQQMKFFRQSSTLETLWKPARLNNGETGGFNKLLNGYAAGWPVITRDNHPAVAPVGGGRSALFVYPRENMAIIVLTNLAGGAPDAYIDEIADIIRKAH